jgi:hypothetical protein
MDPTFGYDDLFAIRVMFQDEFENESDIIRELRYELLQRGMPQADIPDYLRQFYELYGINISLNTINETLSTEQTMNVNENNFINILTEMITTLNTNQPQNEAQTESNDASNNQPQAESNDASNNQPQAESNDASNNQPQAETIDVSNNEVEDNDEDLLEDNDDDLVNEDNDLPALEPMVSTGLMNSIVFTLSANGMQTTLPPIIHQHSPQQLENILNTLINQQGVTSLSSMFAQNLPHPSIFNNMFNPLIAPMQDVAATLNEEELKSLKKYKSDKVLEENCSVCMSKMGNPEEELCKLPCDHDFHAECIEPYLEKYNYKCPICRKEVGKPKFDI